MANTYKALQTITVGAGGAASISFTNIPQTYTDLVVRTSYRTNFAQDYDQLRLTFNGSSTAVYSFRGITGSGNAGIGTESSSSVSSIKVAPGGGNSATASTFTNDEIYIPNYTSSNNKSLSSNAVGENNATTAYASMFTGLRSDTAAITQITLVPESGGNFLQYSTATLYGVFNADVSSAPATPTIGTATAGVESASITFTGVSNAASYTMTSTPGSITGTGATSPITVSGLTGGTGYTFKVKSNNPFGSSAESAASNSITPLGAGFESIATVTVGAGGSAFAEFTSIPSTYVHLQIRAIMQSTRSAAQDTANMRFNGDTNANYSFHNVYAIGSSNSLTSVGASNMSYIEWYEMSAANNANIFSVSIIDILDYANTNKFKTVQIMHSLDFNSSSSSSKLGIFQGNWRSNNAINSIKIYPATGPNFAQYTRIALYGIKAA